MSYTVQGILPITPYHIEKHAGKGWVDRPLRQGISEIDDLIKQGDDSTNVYSISSGNLQLLLNGEIYTDQQLLRVDGQIGRQSLVRIQNAVRSRLLDLTLQLEKTIPAIREISVGGQAAHLDARQREDVKQVVVQNIYGGTAIASAGSGSIVVNSVQGDISAFKAALVEGGIREKDAAALAVIVAEEQPESADEPFGAKAKAWLGRNLRKAADGTWSAGIAVATEVAKEAAMRYYGFK